MIKLSRIIKDYRESGAVNALVNIHAAIDEDLFLTKSGELVSFLALHGPDYECQDGSQLDAVARRFESALRLFDSKFRLYQYLLKNNEPAIPRGRSDRAVVQEALDARGAYLAGKALYTLDTYMAVVYRPERGVGSFRKRLRQILKEPSLAARQFLSPHGQMALLDAELQRGRQILRNKVASFAVQLRDFVRVDVLDHSQGFRVLRRLLNYTRYKAEALSLRYPAYVDFQACDSTLECYPDHLRLDNHYVKVLTLKDPPAKTFANLLHNAIDIPSNYILATEWRQEDSDGVRRLIQSKRRHFHNSKASLLNFVTLSPESTPKDMLIDDGAVGQVHDLGACLEELEIHGRHFGQFSLTVILYDRDLTALERSVAECVKAFSAVDAHLIEERYNLANAWIAALPANHPFNLRRLWLMDSNYADFSLLHTSVRGELRNRHLNAESLAVLESNTGTPYFFNLHWQDVGHTLILGATGSGKSFLINFLVTHLQKYEPTTTILDLGGSYEKLVRLLEGGYLRIRTKAQGIAINPFCLNPSPENLNFLFAFVKVLIELGGYQMSSVEDRDLFEQIENLYVVAPAERRLGTLARILNRALATHLHRWVQGGQFGTWFDNATDNLTLSRFQAFDLAGMDEVPQLLEPLLFYILHRANAAVDDEALAATLKVFIVDEGWRFLRHPVTRRYITEALKTWRKKNALMILATQSTDDLLQSEMLRVVVESCPTKIFLANPDIDPAVYRELFHLNETETGWITRLISKQQMLLKRPDVAKVLNLHVDPKSYWLYSHDARGGEHKRATFERDGIKEGLKITTGGGSSL